MHPWQGDRLVSALLACHLPGRVGKGEFHAGDNFKRVQKNRKTAKENSERVKENSQRVKRK